MITGFAVPILSAYALTKSSLEASWKVSLGIFLMTRKAARVIGLLSGMFLGKGFGSQVLLIDILYSIFGMFALGTVGVWEVWRTGSMVLTYIPDIGRPAELARIYLGSFLATVPGVAIATLYFFTGNAIIPLVPIAVVLKEKAFAKLALRLWVAWVCFFAFFFVTPFLMIWE
ncbi:hypothetical protein K458DRAFT_382262 [Lentithecium fluviatile CBS 122367]|uniref:Uncharacterized protein n=1 Tax=Lentithecium fluviatile CBS 122367 TaxID=1168545 RepID=A0A6G1JKM3_9PLEO|nr:hypothetical protein K458DRAFT_382262 [Lentithecium fluviatile CBS 122367]